MIIIIMITIILILKEKTDNADGAAGRPWVEKSPTRKGGRNGWGKQTP